MQPDTADSKSCRVTLQRRVSQPIPLAGIIVMSLVTSLKENVLHPNKNGRIWDTATAGLAKPHRNCATNTIDVGKLTLLLCGTATVSLQVDVVSAHAQ